MEAKDEIERRAVDTVARMAPGWDVETCWGQRATDPEMLEVHLSHPASPGMILSWEPSSGVEVEHRLEGWLERNRREVMRVAAAPDLVHPTLVMGLRTLVTAFCWQSRELRSLAFLLYESGSLTEDEAAWVTGYVADDATLQPVCPLGPACHRHHAGRSTGGGTP